MSPEEAAALAYCMTLGLFRSSGAPEAQAQLLAVAMAYCTCLAYAPRPS